MTAMNSSDSAFALSIKLWKIAMPLSLSYLLRQGEVFVLLYIAGYISKLYGDPTIFAAISLALMFLNVSCLSITLGMATALDTLCSQHYGNKNFRKVGIVLQRSLIVMWSMLVPIGVIWMFSRKIFTSIGSDSHTCDIIVQYLSITAITLPVRVVGICYRRFLVAIGISWPAMYSSISLVFSLVACALLMVYKGHHLHGGGVVHLAWASVISTHISIITLFATSWRLRDVQKCLQTPTVEAFSNIYEFICLGIPGCVMVCSEWWCFELLTVFANRLGPAAVTGQTLIFQLGNLCFMLPSCLGSAGATLVGNAMGADDTALAKHITLFTHLQAVALELVFICPMMLFQGSRFIAMFIDDKVVRDICASAIPVISAMALTDGLQAVSSGVLRANGRQNVGACVNIGCYYIIGLPLAWVFCFKMDYGVMGLILGVACATSTQCVVLLVLIFCVSNYIFKRGGVVPVLDVGISVSGNSSSSCSSSSSSSSVEDSEEGVELICGDSNGTIDGLNDSIHEDTARLLSCEQGGEASRV
jgi:multidrug resistance protein, MATE family